MNDNANTFFEDKRKIKVIGRNESDSQLEKCPEHIEFVSIETFAKKTAEWKREYRWIISFRNIHEYKIIASIFCAEGLCHMKDYCTSYLYNSYMLKKDFVVFVGECQLQDVAKIYSLSQKTYDVVYLDFRFIEDYMVDMIKLLLVYAKYVIKNNYHSMKKINEIFSCNIAKIINVPFFSFWGCWPQIEQKIEKKNPYNYITHNDKGPFPIADIYINKSIENGECENDVVEKVLFGEYVKNIDIKELFDKCLRLFDLMNLDCDVDLKNLFISSLRKGFIMRDPVHIQDDFAQAIVDILIKKTGGIITREANSAYCIMKNPCTEMIVYPLVKSELRIYDHQKRYSIRESLYKESKEYDIEDWIRYYYQYCSFCYRNGV